MLSLTVLNVHAVSLLMIYIIIEILAFAICVALLFNKRANMKLIQHFSSAVNIDSRIGEALFDFVTGAFGIGALVYLMGTLIILCSY